ncbi:MAG TPA: lytic transglycosylase domain-containing protein [Candidatus Baltobacteraceae bacterium]|jgi:soluble lytic murein transglycosylase-like protein|nr:lytic transglycosylase domain-containing protein [Candidatus Baltobacteraceae bacterium]
MFESMNSVTRRIAQIEVGPFAPARQADGAAFAGALPARPATRVSKIRITSMAVESARAWKVDPALVQAIIASESGFDPAARSRTGAMGLMQLEPETAASLGVGNPYDPEQNIWAGTRYVRGLLERYHGDMRLAVAAYNAGPGAVDTFGGVPPYAETKSYVERVLAAYRNYKARM